MNDMATNAKGQTMSSAMMIDAEIVHNWSQRYIHTRTGQLGELSQDIRADLLRAHMRHHRDGTDAADEARALAAKYPGRLSYPS